MSNDRFTHAKGIPVVGMVGAGQLARMTHQAGISLGIEFVVLARSMDEPAVSAGARALLGRPDDLGDLRRLAEASDVLTLDHEGIPWEFLQALEAQGHRIHPRGTALRAAQDKLWARTQFAKWGLDVPAFVDMADDPVSILTRFGDQVGWPVVVKARSGGYDGRGVQVAKNLSEALPFIERAGGRGLMAEAYVTMVREVALVGVRSPSGAWAAYPLVETRQVDGICRELVTPAPVSETVATQAEVIARTLAETLDATGILAVELFVTPDERLVVNEIALRPHNSGHATIEAATTSQFENHLRAVLDWPLGETTLRKPAAAMVNLLGDPFGGDPRERLPRALAVQEASVHLYGKSPAPGRKLGHVTALGESIDEALATARRCAAILNGQPECR